MNPPTLDDFRAVHDAPPVPLGCECPTCNDHACAGIGEPLCSDAHVTQGIRWDCRQRRALQSEEETT